MKIKMTIQQELCVACGSCVNVCPKKAISIYKGLYAVINEDLCVGCRRCEKTCPASVIEGRKHDEAKVV